MQSIARAIRSRSCCCPASARIPSACAACTGRWRQPGTAPHDWGLGFNLGPTPANFAFLLGRVGQLAREHGQPVALVGWSLGGLYAREIARRQPHTVSRVITMGTPFSGDRRANNAWRAYQLVTGHTVDEPPIECDFSAKPPVPTIALWSPKDGVVAPRSACGWPGERDRAVAVRCNHLDIRQPSARDRRSAARSSTGKIESADFQCSCPGSLTWVVIRDMRIYHAHERTMPCVPNRPLLLRRKPTNISLDATLLEAAKELGGEYLYVPMSAGSLERIAEIRRSVGGRKMPSD